MEDTKICKKCGRILPIEKFRLCTGQFSNPYYRGECKECEIKYEKEYKAKKHKKEIAFLEEFNLGTVSKRKFKEIDKARILDLSKIGIDITLLDTDEMFVRLMDYKNTWLSNYGRVIVKYYDKEYHLRKGSYINGELRYSLSKNVFQDGKWVYRSAYLYAKKAVVDTFIVNEDKAENIYIWHKGYDRADCYYKNLYPLNQKQYRIVKNHYIKSGEDSEKFILSVMNDIRYKPDHWSEKMLEPVMYGLGYHGILYTNSDEESYKRWHVMMNRCYNEKVHELYPEYKDCFVCDEWLNYSNYKLWYNEHQQEINAFDETFDMDKDILIKGNKIYSPETVCFVPHVINTLFVNGRNNRGDYPLGVYYENDRKKYRAGISFLGKRIKLGTFDTAEEAFARYKEYKEDFIKDMAEQYRGSIPDKTYQAMINWKIEIDD